MARRLISLREMDTLEGLIERHYLLQERLEGLEAEAAAYDLSPEGTAELSMRLKEIKLELLGHLENVVGHLKGS